VFNFSSFSLFHAPSLKAFMVFFVESKTFLLFLSKNDLIDNKISGFHFPNICFLRSIISFLDTVIGFSISFIPSGISFHNASFRSWSVEILIFSSNFQVRISFDGFFPQGFMVF
jgi:hypothetical protein